MLIGALDNRDKGRGERESGKPKLVQIRTHILPLPSKGLLAYSLTGETGSDRDCSK